MHQSPVHSACPAPQRTFRIPVSTGIFDHYHEIGDALWLLLFYIDKTTSERPGENGKFLGIVLGGRPVLDAEAAAAFGCKLKTIRRWRRRLEYHGIIRARRTPFGAVIQVVNSQKWMALRQARSPQPGLPETGRGLLQPNRRPLRNEEASARTGNYKEDRTGINRTIQRHGGAAKAAVATPREVNARQASAAAPVRLAGPRTGAARHQAQPQPASLAGPVDQRFPLTPEENLNHLREAFAPFLEKHCGK